MVDFLLLCCKDELNKTPTIFLAWSAVLNTLLILLSMYHARRFHAGHRLLNRWKREGCVKANDKFYKICGSIACLRKAALKKQMLHKLTKSNTKSFSMCVQKQAANNLVTCGIMGAKSGPT